jgi:hypothetical protein
VHDLRRSGLDSVDIVQFSLDDGFVGFADSLGATVI